MEGCYSNGTFRGRARLKSSSARAPLRRSSGRDLSSAMDWLDEGSIRRGKHFIDGGHHAAGGAINGITVEVDTNFAQASINARRFSRLAPRWYAAVVSSFDLWPTAASRRPS